MICSQNIQTSTLAMMECKQVDYQFYPAENGNSSSHWTSVRKTHSYLYIYILIWLFTHKHSRFRFIFKGATFFKSPCPLRCHKGELHTWALFNYRTLLTHHPCLLNHKGLKKRIKKTVMGPWNSAQKLCRTGGKRGRNHDWCSLTDPSLCSGAGGHTAAASVPDP